jgi:hypothetical protein
MPIVRARASAADRPRASSHVNSGAASAARNSPRPSGASTGESQLMRNSPSPTTTPATSIAKRFVLPRTQVGTSGWDPGSASVPCRRRS